MPYDSDNDNALAKFKLKVAYIDVRHASAAKFIIDYRITESCVE